MSAIINSAPHCITSVSGAKPADDSADFIIQAGFQKCLDGDGGFMTFGHGTVYGQGGFAATSQYYILTYVGIAVMVITLVAWVIVENRRLNEQADKLKATGVHVEAG